MSTLAADENAAVPFYPREGSRVYPALFILTVTVFAVFWPVLRADFVEWDDGTLIYGNKNYSPVTTDNLLRFWREPYQKLYTPVTYSVMGVLAVVGKVPPGEANPPSALTSQLDPRVFHAFSLLVHLATTLLVWSLLLKVTHHPWAAGAGALLWAIHPLQVETVAWAGEIKGLLAGFFSLCALNFYVLKGRTRFSLIAKYLAATIFFLLALLSKPSAVCLPFVAAAIGFLLFRHSARRTLLTALPWLAIALLFVLVARNAQPVPPGTSPLAGRLFVAGDALAFYIGKALFPSDLQMIYGRTPAYVLSHWWGYVTWIIPGGLAVLAWRYRRRFPSALTAFAVLTAALLPNLGLVPFIYQRYSTVADRYIYLGMLGPAILLACWFEWRSREASAGRKLHAPPFTAFAALVAVWLLMLGIRTALHVPNWESSLALWSYNINVNPTNWALVNNVGVRELEQGRPARAMVYLQQAARLRPDDPEIHAALATAKFQIGRTDDATKDFQAALKISPGFGRALLGLGNIAHEQGRIEQAQSYYRQALQSKLEPEDAATAHTNLGAMLSAQNRPDEAIAEFSLALRLAPDDAQTHDGLALALARKDEMQQAEFHWQRAIELDKQFAAARINYGTLLAMQDRADEAATLFREALQILPDSAPEKASAHHNLALVLWGRGASKEAIQHWRAALRLNPNYVSARRALDDAMKSRQEEPSRPQDNRQ